MVQLLVLWYSILATRIPTDAPAPTPTPTLTPTPSPTPTTTNSTTATAPVKKQLIFREGARFLILVGSGLAQ